MSAGFWLRSILTIAAGALIVLGVAYEERLIAFEQNLAARWRIAWAKNFGESSKSFTPRPQNIQSRAVSYRTRISSQIEIVQGYVKEPAYAPERRAEIAESKEAAVKSA